MFNKSKIDWCDFTWNPVTGCRLGCTYCYAAKQARRFSGDVRLNRASDQITIFPNGLGMLEKPFKSEKGKVIPFPTGFEPTFHLYRLPMPAEKKKPANIFVCSMGELFGDWVPDKWIKAVLMACDAAPWHNYLFLTKNPQRYMDLMDKGILRTGKNFWYGTSITKPKTEFFWHNDLNIFISIEPIKASFNSLDISESKCCGIHKADWVILGAETGNQKEKTIPQRDWIVDIAATCLKTDTPLFMKQSKELEAVWGAKLIQEFPEELRHPEDKPLPHCLECKFHKENERHFDSNLNKNLMNHFCLKEGKRKIPGRYVRTSPPWCPIR